jgi:hypothetical protein
VSGQPVAAHQDAYQKACDIADQLLWRGIPVKSYEAVDGMIIIRFLGPRAQTVHADAGSASWEGFLQAYRRAPP